MGSLSTTKPLDIVIVGGSIAALFSAIVLRDIPHVRSITILERHHPSDLRDQGAGIRVGEEVAEALQRFTDTPPEKYALELPCLKFLDVAGRMVRKAPVTYWSTSWGQVFRVLRAAFEKDAESEKTKGMGRVRKYRSACVVEDLRSSDGESVEVVFVNENGEHERLAANLVIGADGASSKVRQLAEPQTRRTYAGYVVVRGLVPLDALSQDAQDLFRDNAALGFDKASQMVTYLVPGNEDSADRAKRVLNFVWYWNRSERELDELMTDKKGKRHAFTLPIGGMKDEIVDELRQKASRELAAPFAEVVSKTEKPFAQAITDSMSESNHFLNGSLLLVGDAVSGQRPHTASGLTQSAFHALLLRYLLLNHIDLPTWSSETKEFSGILARGGQEIGLICQSTELDPEKKLKEYLPAFLSVQAQLNTKWKEFRSSNESQR